MTQTTRDILTGVREKISAKLVDAEERVTQQRLQLLPAGGARERLTRELADPDAALSEALQLPGARISPLAT
ncbi:hypothetical protein [Rhodobacter sp. 24-YEA-8]|uniref:hypothetical protein n=1 Tax=Rhodobacter sp. 24-YEA-8 TaxID=1884310 RepID=UPI00089C5432|nr:hypothetical protein [Rhodobacter sp. 24-YEA-8]SED24887.1 hypothetical protein SAMN05519105_3708 [Rhodobacter sp. 24-YEA-8]